MTRRVAWGAFLACQGMGFYFLVEHNRVGVYAFGGSLMLIGAFLFVDMIWLAPKKSRFETPLSPVTRGSALAMPALSLFEMYHPNVTLAHVALLATCIFVLISTVRPAKARPLTNR